MLPRGPDDSWQADVSDLLQGRRFPLFREFAALMDEDQRVDHRAVITVYQSDRNSFDLLALVYRHLAEQAVGSRLKQTSVHPQVTTTNHSVSLQEAHS